MSGEANAFEIRLRDVKNDSERIFVSLSLRAMKLTSSSLFVSAPAKVGSLSRRELNSWRRNPKCLIINLDTSFSIRGDDFKMFLSEHWRCARWRCLIFRNALSCVGECCFPRCSFNHSFSAIIATNEKQENNFEKFSPSRKYKTREENASRDGVGEEKFGRALIVNLRLSWELENYLFCENPSVLRNDTCCSQITRKISVGSILSPNCD